MLEANSVSQRVVVPLIRRHAEDAAFYWQQSDAASSAFALGAQRARLFALRLSHNLEGLCAAGPTGITLSLEALARWQKPAEAFVAFWAALAIGDARAQKEVFSHVSRNPDALLRGVASALTWVPASAAENWLRAALLQDDPVSLVAALRGMARRGWAAPQWAALARHSSPFVRAATCRAARTTQAQDPWPLLLALRDDEDLAVRAEALIAWNRLLPEAERAGPEQPHAAVALWHCVAEQAALAQQATGWYRLQSQRRLARWLRHLAWLVPLGHSGVPSLLSQLPLRSALEFVLYSGDMAQLPFVVQAMHQRQEARWAGWVWQCLTGVDVASAGLSLPNPAVDLDAPLSDGQQDADLGLPLPNAKAVAAHAASNPSATTQRMLWGQAITRQSLAALLPPQADQPQALRTVAAHALAQLHPESAFDLRACPRQQAAQLAQFCAPP